MDVLFRQMLAGVASQLGLVLSATRAGYTVTRGEKTIGFTTFVDRSGLLKILMTSRLSGGSEMVPRGSGRPVDLGDYTQDDLRGENSKVRRVLVAKITEELDERKN